MAENVKKTIEGSGSTQLHCLAKHYVTVIKIIDPVTFIVRETPDPSMSKSARDFLNLEQHILSRFDECDIVPQNFLIPLKGTHVLIKPNNGKLWYRGRVESLFETSKGTMINVYLLDYGTTETVSSKAIRIADDDKVFKVPFQAFEFVLSALKPLSLQFGDNMIMRRGKAQKWDTAAETFVREFLSKSTTVPIQITQFDENGKFYGNMYSIDDEEICLNVELVDHSYAWLDEELIPSNENSNIGNENVGLGNTPDRVTNWLSAIEQSSIQPDVKDSITSNASLSRRPSPAPFSCGDSNVPRELSPTPVLNQSLPHSLSIGRRKLLNKLSMQSMAQSQERIVSSLGDNEKQQSRCQSPQDGVEAGENLNTMEAKGPSTMEAKGPSAMEAKGPSTMEAKGPSTMEAKGPSTMEAKGPSTMVAKGPSTMVAKGPSTMVAKGPSTMEAKGPSTMEAKGPSTMVAKGPSTMVAKGPSTMEAKGPSAMEAKGPSTMEAKGPSAMEAKGPSTMEAKGPSTMEAKGPSTMEAKGPSTMEKHIDSSPVKSPKTNVPILKVPYASPFQKPSFMVPKHGFGRGGVAQYFAPVKLPESFTTFNENVNNVEQLKDDKEEWENGSVSSGSISTVNNDSERPSSQNSSRSSRGVPIDKYLELSKKCQKPRNVSDKLENDGVKISRKPSLVESSAVGFSRYDKYTQLNGSKSDENSKKSGNLDPALLKPLPPNLTSRVASDSFVNVDKKNSFDIASEIEQSDIQPSLVESSAVGFSRYDKYTPLKGKNDENTENSKKSGKFDPASLKPLPPNLTRRVASDSFVNVDKKNSFDIASEIEQSDIQSFFRKNVQFSTDNTYQTNPSSMSTFDNFNNDKEKSSPTRIITYGSNPPKPLERIEEYCFEEPIVRSLENAGIKIPTELQTYLWPAVQRSRSCVAVGLKNSGKSPIVIVLCTDWKSCQEVQAQFNMFGTFRQRNYITTLHGGDKIEDKIVDLLKGYTILVATPSMITKLIDSDTGIDIIDRCCHLILEETNYLIEIFLKDLLKIISEFKKAVNRRGEEATTIYQIIVCTTSWSRGVKSFVKLMPNPLLYFSVYLEAAIYSEIKFHIQITELNQEHAAILAILRNAPTRNTVICASDYEKVQRLGNLLKLNSHECLMVHEKMVIYEMEDIKHQWNMSAASKNNPIIVISDAILHLLNITNAECLIHYNVPDVSKLQFSNRFSCLQDVIKSNESEMKMEMETSGSGKKDGVSHVIINNVNCHQCYELKRIMKSLKYPISTKLRDLAEKELLTRELCHNLLAFGNCDVKDFCRLRHKFFAEIDQPLPQYPHFGIIKILVKFVVNAGLFYANILSHQDSETGDVVTRSRDQFADLNFKLQDHFQNFKIKEMVSNPVVGDLCAVRIVGGSYCRVKITKVHPVKKGLTQKVEVFSIDYGWTRTAELGDVFVLPKSFSSFLPQAVKIRICKVKPIDGSNLWTAQADTYVSELISNRTLIGKVVMSLRDCIYVTNLGTRSDFNSSLVMRLKSQNLAIANPNHIELLQKMCDGVISWKKSPIEVQTIPFSMFITYESFESNSVNEVFVTSVQSPNLFYAVPSQNFSGKLTDLNNLINKLCLEQKLKKAVSIKKDDVVIAPLNSEGRWYRARITQVYEDMVQLYFLDFGDNGSAVFNDVYEMPPDIVQDLPFQAVKCSLAGVKAANGQWSELAIDSFCDMTREDDDDDIYRPLLLKVVQTTMDDHPCSVTLHFIENDASLGLELVKRRLAKDMNSKDLKDTTLNIDDKNDSGEESDLLSETDKLNLEFENNAFLEWAGMDKEIIERLRGYNQGLEPKSVENGHSTLNPIRQLTTDGKHYPKTTWFQTDELVIVHIELPSCSDYSAEISEKFISFQTIHGNKFYDFNEDLFDDVDAGSSSIESLPEKVKFKLGKCNVGQKWPRLTKSTDKKWYIKLHVDHLECDDDTKVVCRPPVRDSYIRHYDDSSSSDGDDNDPLLDIEDL